MKRIVIPILVGLMLFVSNYSLADGNSAVKLRIVKTILKTDASKYIDVPKFVNKLSELDSTNSTGNIAPFVTLIELSYVCLNSIVETEKNINKENICYKFLVEVVRAHNKDVDESFSNDDELTRKDQKELKDMFKVKKSDIKDAKNVVKDGKSVKEWSLTMFKPDKTTKICESNGFYMVKKLSEQPFNFLDFEDCYFESDTDRIACCQHGRKGVIFGFSYCCESVYFNKQFCSKYKKGEEICEIQTSEGFYGNMDIDKRFEYIISQALLEEDPNTTYIQIQ